MVQEKDSEGKSSRLRTRAEETLGLKPSELEDISALSPEKVQQLIHELQVHQIELEIQNEDLRQSQVKLEELKDRYLDLYDFAPVGYLMLNEKGLILEANLTAVRLLGAERQSLTKTFFSRFVCQEFVVAYHLYLKQVFETQSKQTCEIKLASKDGTHFYARLDSIAVQDESGQFDRCRTIVSDITDRKKAEDSLRQSKETLEIILNNVPVMVAFLDQNGCHKYVNHCWQETLGWSLEEAQTKDILSELYPAPNYRQFVVEHIANAAQSWCDFRTQTRDGILLSTLWANVPLSDGSNIGIGLDITERKQAEQAVRESEERFRLAMEATKDGVWDWDLKTDNVFRSPGFFSMLGYKEEEFRGHFGEWQNLVHPEDLEAVRYALNEYLKGATENYEVEFRNVRQIRWDGVDSFSGESGGS